MTYSENTAPNTKYQNFYPIWLSTPWYQTMNITFRDFCIASSVPSKSPTTVTMASSISPTAKTELPTFSPSIAPSYLPSLAPTNSPTDNPTYSPSKAPTGCMYSIQFFQMMFLYMPT